MNVGGSSLGDRVRLRLKKKKKERNVDLSLVIWKMGQMISKVNKYLFIFYQKYKNLAGCGGTCL